MKSIGYIYLMLLSLLLAMLVGCEHRDVLDDYPVSGVQIKLNWTGVTEQMPEGMQAIFYPKDDEGKRVEKFLTPDGGVVSVPPGQYSLLIYNYDTEFVAVRGKESFETFEAYTNYCKGLSTSETMVWSPDPLYVVTLDDIQIEDNGTVQPLEFKPMQVTKHFSFEVKVEGLQYVSAITCSVDGMSGSYFAGKQCCESSIAPIYVETTRGKDVIKGSFSAFILPPGTGTRAKNVVTMMLKLTKVDLTVQKVKVDITEAVTPQPPSGGGEPGENPAPDAEVEIEIPLENDKIVVEEPENSGGGIGGNVDEWGNQTEVELK